jgi:hypothetical protein
MDDVYKLLNENVKFIFAEVYELDSLCTLRTEIIRFFMEEDQRTDTLEPVCQVFLKEIAVQMTRLMATRVRELHRLEEIAKDLITMTKGSSLYGGYADVVGDDIFSIWEAIPGKVKIDQILSMKCTRDRPALQGFQSHYSQIMKGIYAGEIILSQLADRSEYLKDELYGVLTTHQEFLSNEFESYSHFFETLLDNIIKDSNLSDPLIGSSLILPSYSSYPNSMLVSTIFYH